MNFLRSLYNLISETVRTFKENINRTYAIVEFMKPQEAAAALLKHRINIGNDKIIVKPCKQTDFEKYCPTKVKKKVEVDDILLQPPDENSPRNILNILCDDCLNEIFKKLHPSNYGSVADVCVRFNQILKEMLTRKHKNNMLHISDLKSFTLSQADYYLRHFGSLFYQADMDGRKVKSFNSINKSHTILRMVSEHCRNLRHFRIINFSMGKKTMNEIHPLFTRLEKLSVKLKTDLKEKSFISGTVVNLPPINCPKLVAFEWDSDQFFPPNCCIPALSTFLYHNKQLESFLFYGDAGIGEPDSRCHLPMNISLFGRFKNLKFLSIKNLGEFVPKIIKRMEHLLIVTPLMHSLSLNNVPIEYLELGNGLVNDDAIEYISQIKTIRRFAFVNGNSAPSHDIIESYIIRLESSLPNLEVLLFQTNTRTDIVFTDQNIHIIEQLKKGNRKLRLPIQEFKSNKNTFTHKYKYITTRNRVRSSILIMRKVNKILFS